MKRIFLILMAALMLCTLTSCSGKQNDKKTASTLETPLKELVVRHMPEAKNMMEMPLADLEDYIGIEPSQYTEALYLQEGTLAGDEALVIRAVDSKEADNIKTCLEGYLAQRCKETQNYLPEAYKILKECSVQRKNNTVALIVTEKTTDITALLLAGE